MSRTLVIVVIAAALLAIVQRSDAQIYYVNAVSYLNKDIPPGFSLINVPLRDTAGVIFPTAQLPAGFALYLLRDGQYDIATFDSSAQTFSGAALSPDDFKPGRGFFVHNPTANSATVTFVGVVPQGRLTNHIPAGFSIQSSQVPQAGTVEELGFPIEPGDAVYIFDAARQRYSIHVFDDLELRWLPAPPPRLQPGDAFLMRSMRAKEFVRVFSVNQ